GRFFRSACSACESASRPEHADLKNRPAFETLDGQRHHPQRTGLTPRGGRSRPGGVCGRLKRLLRSKSAGAFMRSTSEEGTQERFGVQFLLDERSAQGLQN